MMRTGVQCELFDSSFKKTMNLPTASQFPFRAFRVSVQDVYPWRVMLALGVAVALFATGSPARSAETTAPAPAASQQQQKSAQAARAATPAPVPPRYADSDLKRAFSYMDSNHDNKVSREEAAGFRGVARHFDQADTNRDSFLSRKEFDTAMNYVKPKK